MKTADLPDVTLYRLWVRPSGALFMEARICLGGQRLLGAWHKTPKDAVAYRRQEAADRLAWLKEEAAHLEVVAEALNAYEDEEAE